MRQHLLFPLAALFIFSCSTPSPEKESLNGIWSSIASGWTLHIEDSLKYSWYNISPSYCQLDRQAELEEIISSLSVENDTLHMSEGVMTYSFIRVDSLPSLCSKEITEKKRNEPLFNFQVFAETVEEHYAFMELNALDWPQIHAERKAKLDENSSDAELYLVLEECLEIIKDNHGFLEATEEVYLALESLEQVEEETQDLYEYGDFEIADMVTAHHLSEDMTQESWLMSWGMMEDSIGYLQVKAMWLHADLEIPESLIKELGYVDAYVQTFHQMDEGGYIKKEVEGVSRTMDRVMKDLRQSRAIIIDVRFNGGGQDAVSFEILRRFNPERKEVVRTELSFDGKTYPTRPILLDSHSQPYTQPVYILTSGQTGSAAEAFTIASAGLGHIKRIGVSTQGATSTSLEKKLPNGWYFAISNEVYMDMDGRCYENIGYPADWELPYPEGRQAFFKFVAEDLKGDKERILRSISELENRE